jgi:hypothetical protein
MSNKNISFVSSFSPNGFVEYGKKFIESFDSDNINLFIGVEDDPSNYPKKKNIFYFRLSLDIQVFLQSELNNFPDSVKNDYRFQASKFCQKVLAINNDILPKEGYRIWIDADVLFLKKMTQQNMLAIVEGFDITYLGRSSWHHSESGFVAFFLNDNGKSFIRRWLWYFDSGRVFSLAEWHDAYVFDVVRREFNGLTENNLSKGVHGLNVWPSTELSKYMTHFKGNSKNNLST